MRYPERTRARTRAQTVALRLRPRPRHLALCASSTRAGPALPPVGPDRRGLRQSGISRYKVSAAGVRLYHAMGPKR